MSQLFGDPMAKDGIMSKFVSNTSFPSRTEIGSNGNIFLSSLSSQVPLSLGRYGNLFQGNLFETIDDQGMFNMGSSFDHLSKYLTKGGIPRASSNVNAVGHGSVPHASGMSIQFDSRDIFEQLSGMQGNYHSNPGGCSNSQSSAAGCFNSSSTVEQSLFGSTYCSSHTPLSRDQAASSQSSQAKSSADNSNRDGCGNVMKDLEVFSEKFKQRRIKLGVTQADVGRALAHLKIPGVGSLSQSTICRFESLTLSQNNMLALKPILETWLDEAERAQRTQQDNGLMQVLDKKRKRTSIGCTEKKALESYFTVNPRPSSDKIATIADKLELSKSVVRVWFCNQRQKRKRMKFAVN